MLVAQKVTTPDELDKAMKKVQPAMQAAQKAVKSEAYADVKTQLATIKQVMDDYARVLGPAQEGRRVEGEPERR